MSIMSTNCNISTTVVLDNTPLECDQYYSTQCVINPQALAYLGIPANSTQEEINAAINLALINSNNKIIQLQNQSGGGGGTTFTNKEVDIEGDYVLSADDNKKYVIVNSISDTPRIVLDEELPDGFECYIVNNTPPLESYSLDDVLAVTYEFDNQPFFTIPMEVSIYNSISDIVKPYGTIYVRKQTSDLYTVTGDLTYFPS